MEFWDIIIYTLPLIIGAITAFIPIKDEIDKTTPKPLYKRITIWGIILIPVSIFYFVAGIINLYNNDTDKKNDKNEISSLREDVKYIKNQSEIYYRVLTVLGYKLDTTTLQGRRQTDSLLGIIIGQELLLDNTKVNIKPCIDDNFTIKAVADDLVTSFHLCNNSSYEAYDIKVENYAIHVYNGKMTLLSPSKKYAINTAVMDKNSGLSVELYMSKDLNEDSLYTYFKGSYRDAQNRQYSFKTVVLKYPHELKSRLLNDDGYELVKNLLKENNVW
jgi:hypothetical protein